MESLFSRAVIFKNVFPKSAAAGSPGNLLKMQSTGSTPELPHQDLWGGGPAIGVLTSPAGNPDAHLL